MGAVRGRQCPGDHGLRPADGTAQPVRPDELPRLVARGEIELVGATSDEASWIGAPLPADGRTVGAIVVQSYVLDHQYSDSDLELLAFVGQHIGSALSRARAIEETRQRNAELALINEIGDALAQQLDFDGVIELIGERLRAIFAARSVSIGIYDRATDAVDWRYEIDEGERIHTDPTPAGAGLTSHVVRTGHTLRRGTAAELAELGAIRTGSSDTVSWLGAPIRDG